jgi:hypothetical protein
MGIGGSYFLRRPSAWAQIQSWRENQRAFNTSFTSTASSAADTLMSAASGSIDGTASLAAQAALTRIKKAAADKAAKSADTEAKTNLAWTPPKQTAVELPDGTSIDLASGLMTKPDGSMIDTVTGLPKVNVTV